MLNAHARGGAELTMAICLVPDVARYGALELCDDRVQGFLEKGRSGPGWINAGTYVLGPDLRARLRPQGAFSFEHDLLAPEVRSIRPFAFRASGMFIDIGIPEDYARVQQIFSRRLAQWKCTQNLTLVSSRKRDCRRVGREPRHRLHRTTQFETARRFAKGSPDSVSGLP